MIGYCEVPSFYSETYPKTRKEHLCCECDGVIRVGETYARCVGKLDGEMFCYTQHKACRDFAAEVNSAYGHFGECFIPFEGVNEAIRDAHEFAEPQDAITLQARWAVIRAAGRQEVAP